VSDLSLGEDDSDVHVSDSVRWRRLPQHSWEPGTNV
jgi:hypothetical protein